jgi:N-methylhydantoinase B
MEPSDLPGKVTAFPLEEGYVVVMRSAGGGGFGDPLERDPALVQRDREFGYVSVQAAGAIYGADTSATAARRRALKDQQIRLKPVRTEARPGRRRALLSPRTAKRLGLAEGELIEIAARGPSLRAWLLLSLEVEAEAIGLDGDGLALAGADPGGTVTLRRIENVRG